MYAYRDNKARLTRTKKKKKEFLKNTIRFYNISAVNCDLSELSRVPGIVYGGGRSPGFQ